jgi:uncharacterized repeat protein (TIGR01451 family)
MTVRAPIRRLAVAVVVLLVTVVWLGAARASAAVPSPGWVISAVAAPTNFSANENATCLKDLNEQSPPPPCDSYIVRATNAGKLESSGTEEVTLSDTLPPGLTVQRVALEWQGEPGSKASGFVAGAE